MSAVASIAAPRPPRLIETLALAILCTLILAAPAFTNGRPFIFFDSEHYFTVGERILGQVGGILSLESQSGGVGADGLDHNASPSHAAPTDAAPAQEEGGLAVILAGRSPTYGVFFAGLTAMLGMWAVVFAQAALASVFIIRFLDIALRTRAPGVALATTAICSFLSSAGYHAGFMMPDIFAGIGVLALLCLLTGQKKRVERALLGFVIFAAATAHSTIFMLLALLLLSAIGLSFTPLAWKAPRLAFTTTALALFSAFALNAAYNAAAEYMTGQPLRAAPYLTARVIADGPGQRYIRERCGEQTFATCAYATDDYGDHNDFLWGGAGAVHSFIAAPRDVQYAMQDEQFRFVLHVAAAYPLEQIQASLGNAFTQFFMAGVPEPNFGAYPMVQDARTRESSIVQATPDIARCIETPDACARAEPFNLIWQNLIAITNVLLPLALIAVLAFWLARRMRDGAALAPIDPLLAVLCLAVLALFINAAVCGVLSGPHNRYQARLIWIAPVVLAAILPHARQIIGAWGPRAPLPEISEKR